MIHWVVGMPSYSGGGRGWGGGEGVMYYHTLPGGQCDSYDSLT